MKITVEVKIGRAQYCFLRDRYGKRDGIGADKLMKRYPNGYSAEDSRKRAA